MSSTSVAVTMDSSPGRVVWQNDILLPHLLTALIAPVPSTQYGLSGNGFWALPFESQNRPPFMESG